MRSGTAIGALIREAEHGESKNDFIHKLAIALNEANETEYWLELPHQSEYIGDQEFKELRSLVGEMNRLLISIIKSQNGISRMKKMRQQILRIEIC